MAIYHCYTPNNFRNIYSFGKICHENIITDPEDPLYPGDVTVPENPSTYGRDFNRTINPVLHRDVLTDRLWLFYWTARYIRREESNFYVFKGVLTNRIFILSSGLDSKEEPPIGAVLHFKYSDDNGNTWTDAGYYQPHYGILPHKPIILQLDNGEMFVGIVENKITLHMYALSRLKQDDELYIDLGHIYGIKEELALDVDGVPLIQSEKTGNIVLSYTDDEFKTINRIGQGVGEEPDVNVSDLLYWTYTGDGIGGFYTGGDYYVRPINPFGFQNENGLVYCFYLYPVMVSADVDPDYYSSNWRLVLKCKAYSMEGNNVSIAYGSQLFTGDDLAYVQSLLGIPNNSFNVSASGEANSGYYAHKLIMDNNIKIHKEQQVVGNIYVNPQTGIKHLDTGFFAYYFGNSGVDYIEYDTYYYRENTDWEDIVYSKNGHEYHNVTLNDNLHYGSFWWYVGVAITRAQWKTKNIGV